MGSHEAVLGTQSVFGREYLALLAYWTENQDVRYDSGEPRTASWNKPVFFRVAVPEYQFGIANR